MIAGAGCDLVEVRRLREALRRHPRRLPLRLLGEKERAEFAARKYAPEYLAGRVAAKEALSKALQTGVRAPLFWRGVAVLNGENGAPFFDFGLAVSEYLRGRGIAACHVSISHDGGYAAAFVVAEFAGAKK